ncbi:haloacid dehalogenase [Pseudohyphozyma bogoriensis]|nr:haloacid dehalogenase [Pseudohyphozyma bogoriensis]
MSSDTSTKRTPIVFDVLGTLFSFESTAAALIEAYPSLSPAAGQAIIDDLFHSAQRDFTYLSMNASYTPIATILRSSLPRVLMMNHLVPLTDDPSTLTNDLDPILSTFGSLPPRPSLQAASNLLVSSKRFALLAASNGGSESTRSLLERALKDEAKEWDVFSCDEIKVAKPDQEVYEAVWEKLGVAESKGRHGWFKTCWVSYEEFDPLTSVWGTPDLICADLEEAAKKIVELEN